MVPHRKIFLEIAAPVTDTSSVYPDDIKILLCNVWSTFPIKGNPIFINGPKSLPKNSPDCPILCNWAFDNFILAN